MPDFEDYSMKGRTYRFMEDALYPFGYGLSYTTFLIGDAKISSNTLNENGSIKMAIPVLNTGDINGTEIVQVYIRKKDDSDGPIKTLKGFKRVNVESGKSSEAIIELPYDSFEFYNRQKVMMTVEPGDYEIMYGNTSDSKKLRNIKVSIQ